MSDAVGGQGQGRQAEAIDLSVLERVERELDAVERALEQVDQGVYAGFAGLDEDARTEPVAPADTGAADAEDEGPAGYI
jgi:hypothetical protein